MRTNSVSDRASRSKIGEWHMTPQVWGPGARILRRSHLTRVMAVIWVSSTVTAYRPPPCADDCSCRVFPLVWIDEIPCAVFNRVFVASSPRRSASNDGSVDSGSPRARSAGLSRVHRNRGGSPRVPSESSGSSSRRRSRPRARRISRSRRAAADGRDRSRRIPPSSAWNSRTSEDRRSRCRTAARFRARSRAIPDSRSESIDDPDRDRIH